MKDAESSHGLWWRFYFALLCVLFALSALSGPASPLDVALTVVHAFALVGLFGYLRSVAIGWREFWLVYLGLSLSLHATGLAFALSHEAVRETGLAVILTLLALLMLPMFLALWRYAFRCPGLWAASISEPMAATRAEDD